MTIEGGGAVESGTNGSTPEIEPTASDRSIRGDVAIIGMAGIFPGAPDLTTYWENILARVDAVTDPPPGAWDEATHFDPASSENDRVYCKRAGYLGPVAFFNPLASGIMPLTAEGGEPDQWLALEVARAALADAGYADRLDARQRTAVVIGKGNYVNRGNLSMVQHGLIVDEMLHIIRQVRPDLAAADLAAIRDELKRGLPPFTPETASGLIPNVTAGRIANRLDLMGPSYTVDAACASSLIAAQIGMRDLLTHECDLALVGGAHLATSVPIFALFCQLNALSRRQEIRPFDKDADGTILGEGIGMIVLKRRDDAERDGDRIYAFLKGIGTSSDGRGVSVMAPRPEGEVLALERAYRAAGVSPTSVGLIEAHGTATPVGDAAEMRALNWVFGPRPGLVPTCAIGSVKSMIGHTMPAAGIAGLIKAALALYHRVLPPTLHLSEPNPSLGFASSRFYLNTETRPWVHGDATPRRAGVNAFGFGGINAHAVLEEAPHADESRLVTHQLRWETEALILRAADREDLIAKLDQLQAFLEQHDDIALKDLAFTLNVADETGPCRLALVASDVADLRSKLARARPRLVEAKTRQIKDVGGIYFFAQPLGLSGKIAVLFPGEGSQYPGMLADLCIHLPTVRSAFDQMDRILADHPRGYRPSDVFFPPPHLAPEQRQVLDDRLWQSDSAWEAVLTSNHALWSLAIELGIRPDVVIGHSTGEYSAMRATGALDVADEAVFGRFVRALNAGYQDAVEGDRVPRAGMLAVGAERERVEGLVTRTGGDLYVAMDNCLHQAVIVGETSAVERARELAQQDGLIYEYLSFDRAYHTPLFAPYLDHLRHAYAQVPIRPPHLTLYSCTTAAPYPSDPAEIRRLMADHWVLPVEFRRTIEALYADGVRLFVEAGPRGNLTTFVEDILRGRPFAAVPLNVQRRSGITQLNHAVALLSAHSLDLNLAPLYQRRQPRRVAWRDPDARPAPRVALRLETAYGTLRLSDELVRRLSAPSPGPGNLREAPAHLPSSPEKRIVEDPPASSPGRSAGPAQVAARAAEPMAEVRRGSVADPVPVTTDETFGAPPEADSAQVPAVATGRPRLAPAVVPVGSADDLPGAESTVAAEARPPTDPVPASPRTQTTDDGGETPNPIDVAAPAVADRSSPVDVVQPSTDATMQAYFQTMETFLLVQRSIMTAYLGGASRVAPPLVDLLEQGEEEPTPTEPRRFPLLGEVLSLIPGEELVARRTFALTEDLYLLDHTLGRSWSADDPTIGPLPVVPLTITLEVLAEAASYLWPELVVVALREVRANRWIALDDGPQTLEITARRSVDDPRTIRVAVRNLTEDERSADPPRSPVAEALVCLADTYPEPPPVGLTPLTNERASRWRDEELYERAMFHGPTWRAVKRVERTGDDGAIARMEVLPFDGFFASTPAPRFVLDPIALDAAGQVPGFWSQEHLPEGNVLFPFRVDAIEVFGPQRPVGELLRCATYLRLEGELQMTSTIDVFDGEGKLWFRLLGWADKRFYLPPWFYKMLLSLDGAEIATPWPAVADLVAGRADLEVRRLSARFPSDRAFWKRVWANAILGRREREYLAGLRTPDQRQLLWLAGRLAAKEAVLALLRRRQSVGVPPADVEVLPDERGRPVVSGRWLADPAEAPLVSIAHDDETAVAVAWWPVVSSPTRTTGALGLGIDLERRRPRERYAGVAFTREEASIVESAGPERADEWALRAWCAKEAVAKALGQGLVDGPGSLQIVGIDPARGTVEVKLAQSLARAFPTLAATTLVASTLCEDDWIVALTLCETRGQGSW